MKRDAPEAVDRTLARPTAITVLCLLGWAVVALVVARILARWQVFHALPGLRIGATIGALGVTVVALCGFWRMRRWSLWVLASALLARLIAALVGGLPLRAVDLGWPLALLLIGAAYARRMK